jgi:hypothetical protein
MGTAVTAMAVVSPEGDPPGLQDASNTDKKIIHIGRDFVFMVCLRKAEI